MKRGFTLAEVLITLGIIGVVAALTIPTLINNYQKKINGTNPPNINGKDLFVFIFRLNEGKIIPEGYVWGKNHDLTTPDLQGNCNKNAQFGGTYCATVIMNAGWEMPKNYPW